MAIEVLMPRQGNTVESCIIIKWNVKEGDSVKEGDIICEVETDKATFEIEAPADGTLLKIFYQEGEDVPVLTNIAVIGKPGENIDKFVPDKSSSPPKPEQSSTEQSSTEQSSTERSQTAQPIEKQTTTGLSGGGAIQSVSDNTGISPRARNLAAAKGLNIGEIKSTIRTTSGSGSGPGGRIIERDVLEVLKKRSPLTPAAIDAKNEKGLSAGAGTGIGGRVLLNDLVSSSAQAGSYKSLSFPGPVEQIPVKGIRKIISERMIESLTTTAQYTLHSSADASVLLNIRKKYKNAPEETGFNKVTLNDLVLYVVSRVLLKHKNYNSHFLGDKIVQFEQVHLGFAVDTPRGLMVPVIKNVHVRTLREMADERARLVKNCLEGGINPDDLTGATFTVSNLGSLGVEHFTPVINPPEVGILGVCTTQQKPAVRNGQIVLIPYIGLSLTSNHQAIDGAPAARFLKDIADTIANLDLLFSMNI